MSAIKQAYLMWIGELHYSTIESYVREATALGVSKRLPDKNVAMKLMLPGTVCFLAHDEGEKEECGACMGAEECSECAGVGHVATIVCDECAGAGKVMKGAGGHVVVDGELWTWRRFTCWLRQPEKFKRDDHDIESEEMCAHCSGFGHRPLGKVFGMFLPQQIEYLLKSTDTAEVAKDMADKGFVVRTAAEVLVEKRRGCGYRKEGGVYVSTTAGPGSVDPALALAELTRAGKLGSGEVAVHGNFVQFLEPVEIDEKRFRGIKRWHLAGDVKAEADFIMDAVA